MASALFLVLLPNLLMLLCNGQNKTNTTFVLTANQVIFERLFHGPDAHLLSTIPLCYTKETENDDGTTKASEMSVSEYLEMHEAANTTPLVIKVVPQILQLVDLSERSQTLTLVLTVYKFWKDCRLRWIEEDTISHDLHVSPAVFRKLNVFKPSVRLLETLDPKDDSDSETEIILNAHGKVTLAEDYSTVISCNIDVRMYPFDIQTCYLTFESVLTEETAKTSYTIRDVRMASNVMIGRYTPSDQWSLTILPPVHSLRSTCGTRQSLTCLNDGLKYRMILRRQPNYQLVNLLFPAFFIVVISSCVFIVPPGGGDKMGLSVSILLSLYMFSQLMYDKMPETGSFVPLLSEYFLVCIGLVTASCLYASLSAVFAAACLDLPYCLRVTVEILGPIFIFDLIEKPTPAHFKSLPSKVAQAKSDKVTGTLLTLTNGKMYDRRVERDTKRDKTCSRNGEKDKEKESAGFRLDKPHKLTWAAFGALLDRIFFLMHLAVTALVMMSYVVHGYSSWKGYSSLNLTEGDLMYMCVQLAMHKDENRYDLPCSEYANLMSKSL